MKNTFAKKFTVCALAGVLGAAFIGCGDDGSSSPKGTGLPAEVGDMAELETYECGMDVIGEKVYVTELEENYECDGEKWFKSYDQTKPSSSSAKSSSSMKADGSSDSKNSDRDGSSSSDATASSSSAKSSSSRQTEILEPEITVNETCTEVGACDAMVKTDISTWHFVRKDNFGDDAEYTYTVDGKDLIITIKNADGSKNSKTYSMYNMESEVGMEMAFNAAKATCEDGGGNDVVTKTCVQDTVYSSVGIKYGSLLDERDGQVYKTVTIGTQTWMAENLNYNPGDVSSMGSDAWSGCYGEGNASYTEEQVAANCDKYGRLYTWEVAMDKAGCGYGTYCNNRYLGTQGICPQGWHLPTKEEWQQLVKPVAYSVDDYTTYWYYNGAGVELKTVDGWSYYSSSTAGTNASGFTALPAGYRSYNGNFVSSGSNAYFWSASEYSGSNAYCLILYYNLDSAGLFDDIKDYAYSVRCVKDSK